jgi:hypothetical protein
MDCRFEDMPAGDFTAHFGTAVTSESLQYLKLDEALPEIEKKINKNMDTVNPATFAANKHYVLMVIEHTG